MARWSKHLEFYTHTVTFLVEDCLFRVSREPLAAESTVFRGMFLLPQGDSETVEGQSDTCPVILQGVSKWEFESLLRALLIRQHGKRKGSSLGKAQWISVLKLSTMWEFKELRKAAIQYLDSPSQPLDPVNKLALASKYEIKRWQLPALLELAKRSLPISVEEGRLIGLENALKLAVVREQFQRMKLMDVVLRDYTLKPADERGSKDKDKDHRTCFSLIRKAFDL
ncbi:hypothetical protein BKA82DRAFT_1002237 [Pisolithus tinctorius]|uniref:BTB domain-containing protein n=1 Tax=Pisolithus tinctorius Marx 270 TaxID=870435 RepID=A0A0C3P540_PISTI|nr:hypothetical protein BKA82DRAFT_1002237 [Pisolithus tinctorius]KIO02621.1 hypothetical protein M404DRAFT_1002237 [Pisolithus tinctorius Marx 270]